MQSYMLLKCAVQLMYGQKKIRVLIKHDVLDTWAAQCLEYDIAAQAKNLDDLIQRLEEIFVLQEAIDLYHEQRPFADVPAAPKRFFDLAEKL